jgi:peptide/nickel transport system substrate-binding protein
MIRQLNLRGSAAYLLLLALIIPILAACGGATTGPQVQPTGESGGEPTAVAPEAAPAAGQAGGTLKILYWQAPTILNPHQGQGTKDSDAAHVMLEPLAHWDASGKPVAFLAAELPTIENGGVAEDGTTIT